MSSFTSQHFRIKNKTPSSPTIPLSQQIFCNVELKGSYLEAIGFDMDFTLAQYNEEFDKLAFEGAKQNLVNKKGYPSEVLDFQYDSTLFTRGLVIDKPRGNFLKMDRHKYVRKLYHGLTPVSRQERKEIYLQSYAYMPSFSESDFVNIDTIFLLVDALLFAQLVDLKDRTGNAITKTYSQLFEDVRACVDICHKDGTIQCYDSIQHMNIY
jgi:HAD superfamily 5'-nucleotidase-like hydrolase